jgi:hypothetical protein
MAVARLSVAAAVPSAASLGPPSPAAWAGTQAGRTRVVPAADTPDIRAVGESRGDMRISAVGHPSGARRAAAFLADRRDLGGPIAVRPMAGPVEAVEGAGGDKGRPLALLSGVAVLRDDRFSWR